MATDSSSILADYKKSSFKELCTTLSMVGEAVDLLAKNSRDLSPEDKLVLWTERLQTLLILMGCMLYQRQAEFGEDEEVKHHYETVKRFLEEGVNLVKNDFKEIHGKMEELTDNLRETEAKLRVQDESPRKRGKSDVVCLE